MNETGAQRAPFTIALVQERATDDVAGNVLRHEERIREAHARGAVIVCLQELFNAPYFAKSLRAERFDLAEPIPGRTTERMQRVASELGVVIVAPIYERQAAGLYRNSAAVIDADGTLLGVYRKMHIPHDPLFEEKYYFAPGEADGSSPGAPDASRVSGGFRVWKTRYADIGVLICWDQWYPEGARLMALAGAEVLLYPTAIGWNPNDDKAEQQRQRNAWITIQCAHAIANGIPVLTCNRVGFEPDPSSHTTGALFWGSSFVAGPQGEILASAPVDAPAVLVAELDLGRSEQVRRLWPYLRDRRIDAYQGLLQRYLD
jgi:N-carbamoylputrescine amidase